MPYARDLRLDTLNLEQDGGVLVARYESPPLNFMTSAFVDDWDHLTRAVDRDGSVGAVVLTGEPEDRFITHFDVEELAATAETPSPPLSPLVANLVVRAGIASLRAPGGRAAWLRYGGPLGRSLVTLGLLHRVIRRMHRSGVVYVAAVNGPCLGGGLEMALACDLRFAADSPVVQLGQIEILGGIIPGAGGTQHLPRVVGTAKAVELVLDGRSLSAAEALEIGLVNGVHAPSDLLPEAARVAARLASRSPESISAAKRAVYGGASLPMSQGLYVESAGLVIAGKTWAARRLARAFADDLSEFGETPFLADRDRWHSGSR
jgi:enoyl-CoA hydratase/carnithine racemase